MRKFNFLVLAISALLFSASQALADGFAAEPEQAVKEQNIAPKTSETKAMTLERASGEDLASAIGHYAKSRSLLLAAIREFDLGYKLARPDSLLNSKEWRNGVINKAQELERVLAPQPRVTHSGVKFEGDNRLLKTDSKTEAKKK